MPLLTVVFLASYRLDDPAIVEQGDTIQSQRQSIQRSCSVTAPELWAAKGKGPARKSKWPEVQRQAQL